MLGEFRLQVQDTIFKLMQHTLINVCLFKGVGLHSGLPVSMTISPAMANEGIRFIRKDIDENNVIMARWDNVVASQLCTLLKNDHGTSVSTVEHVMAALAGMGIDNATITVDGPELPIMDGSALPFVTEFKKVGIEKLNAPRQAIKILKPVEVRGDNGSFARFEPDTESSFEFSIDFDNRFIGEQTFQFTLGNNDEFSRELADSPTFTTKDQVDQLKAMDLIKGGDVTNADIYADDAIYRDKSRPRKERAAVRHKMLDALGDTYLLEMPFIGKFISEKGGHSLTNQLIRMLMADKSNYMIVTDHMNIGVYMPVNQSSHPNLAYNA
jgi:UDP-3-O-[3-hydroxymyristoyl] N-acetylglucosamine deacetylase